MVKVGAVALALAILSCAMPVFVNAVQTGSGFPVPSYYVLGDDYMDAGNNNYIRRKVPKANFRPYGITYFKGVPTGRFCDGRIFSDLLAVIMKLPQAVPSLSNPTLDQKGTCINHASGGAGILQPSSAALGVGNALSFDAQVVSFETNAADVVFEFGADQALLILNDAIYHLSFGAVDILAYFTKPAYATTVGPTSKFLDGLVAEYRRLIDRLYLQGARKVVVFGVGPIHKSPKVLLMTSKMKRHDVSKLCASIDAAVRQLNSQLRLMVNQLNADNDLGAEHASLQLLFADVYGAVTAISKYPSRHGFSNVKDACCGAGKFGAEVACGARGHKVCKQPQRSLYWNDMQFTEAGNKRLFKLFFDGSSYIKPFSIKHLAKLLIPGVPY